MDESYVCSPCLDNGRYFTHLGCRVLAVLGTYHDKYVMLSKVTYEAHDMTCRRMDVVLRTIHRLALRYGLDIAQTGDEPFIAFLWSTRGQTTESKRPKVWLPRGGTTRLDLARWCPPNDHGMEVPKVYPRRSYDVPDVQPQHWEQPGYPSEGTYQTGT